MKLKSYIITMVCILFVIIFTTSYTNIVLKKNLNVTTYLAQIENEYAQLPPDTGKVKKEEPIYDNNFKKIEDTTAHKAFHEKIDTAINNSYSKTKIITSEVSYGVIKDGNCFGYPELDVFMDCEDHNNGTKYFGWIGSNLVDSRGNVLLKFCIVDGSADFHKTNVDYAVLALGGYPPNTCSSVELKTFTNEVGDHGAGHNSNYTLVINNNIATDIFSIYSDGYYGDCSFSDNSHTRVYEIYHPHSDTYTYKPYYTTQLGFFYFQKDPSYDEMGVSDFPNLTALGGWNYGVFGRFGNHQGYIYTDDEDNDNNDNEWEKNFDSGGVTNIMESVGNVNSRIYFSKVKNCHY